MASSTRRQNQDRQSRALGTARTTFALNPDFGYFNSQVSDKDAFRHYLNVPAGEKTQAELQELSQNTAMPSHVESGGDILRTHSDTAPITVKIEKENYPLAPTGLHTVSRPSSAKRARVDEDTVVKTENGSVPGIIERNRSDALRISQLEAEVAHLRSEILVNQLAAERVIRELQRDWQYMRQDCINFQVRVGGLIVRMDRVERHTDEIVGHLSGHHGWKSEIGSDFDPDATLAEVEVEDGSQPVEEWIQGHDWSEELGEGEDEKKGIDTAV